MKTLRKYWVPKALHDETQGKNRSDFISRAINLGCEHPELMVEGLRKRLQQQGPLEYVYVNVSIDVKTVENLKSLSQKVDLTMDTMVKLMLEAQM